MKDIDWEKRHFQICLALLSNPKIMEGGSTGKFVIKKADQIIEQLKKHIEDTSMPTSKGLIRKESGRKWGFVDENNNWIIDPVFDYANNFSEGLAPVEVDSLWGYIDESGDFVLDPKYTSAGEFYQGVAFVQEDFEMYGLINKSFDVIHDPMFSEVCDFKEDGYARVRIHPDRNDCDDNGLAWLDTSGNLYLKKPGK